MHPNNVLLDRLFSALDRHDHAAMAACYAPDAHFHDIAFDLHGRDSIHGMCRMICSGDITLTFRSLHADDQEGSAHLVEIYTFGASQSPYRAGHVVQNEITSRFQFANGLITRHIDNCDPKKWARQALGGGIKGFLAGRIRLLRSLVANARLDKFLRNRSPGAQ